MLDKRKGLFGAMPGIISGFGGGTWNMDGTQATPMQRDVPDAPEVGSGAIPQAQAGGKAKSGGFFGSDGIGTTILGSIGDYLMQVNGLQPTFAPTQMFRRQQEFASQKAQQQREYDMQDWQHKQEWERANPKPVNNDTTADYDFRRQVLGEDAAKEWLRNSGDPIVTVPLPNGQVYSGPRSQLSVALTGQPAQQTTSNAPAADDAPTIIKNVSARGYILPEEEQALRPRLGKNGEGAFEGWMQAQKIKRVTRTGRTADGRKVIQFSDGTTQYAD